MIGQEQIIRYRSKGKKPYCIVFKFGKEPNKPKYEWDNPERQIEFGFFPVVYVLRDEKPDVRFVVGCTVIVHGELTDEFYAFLDRVTAENPSSVLAGDGKTCMLWKNKEWSVSCQY